MKKLRYGLIVLMLLVCPVTYAGAQVSIGIGLPNLSIGINLPVYPNLVPVPGYPVYYAPQVTGNYFFYDGMYWVFQDDNWYASSWYNGPWGLVEIDAVPLFILRVPVRYYRQPPVYFRGWQSTAPPRWGQRWGSDWEERHRGWDRWRRNAVPVRAPLPVYQRQYAGERYPRVEQQHAVRSQSYHYQSRDRVVRQHLQQHPGQRTLAPAERGRPEAEQGGSLRQGTPRQQGAPARQYTEPSQRGAEVREQRQPQEQRAPRVQERGQRQQERGDSQEPDRERGQGRDREDDRGRGR